MGPTKRRRTTGTANKADALKFEARTKEQVCNTVYLGAGQKAEMSIEDAITQYFHDNEHRTLPKTYQTCRTKLVGKMKCRKTKKQIRCFGFDEDAELGSLSERDIQKLITSRRKEGEGKGHAMLI